MKKCIGCENLITSDKKKLCVFKKQKFCSRKCGLVYRNKVNNPMSDPLVLEKISGKNSKFWLGENAGYFSKHDWIREQGINREKCLHCGINGFFYKNNRWSIEFCNISGEYKRIIEDWITLCRNCHRKMDIGKRDLVEIKCNECNCSVLTKFPNYKKFCEGCIRKRHNHKVKLRKRYLRLL
jgi:hypothetical protein